MHARIVIAVALAVVAPLAPAAPMAGQTVTGTIHDGTTDLPIRGAFLELLDSAGKRATASLSDSAGGFIMPVRAGRYALRAEALGYEDAVAVTLELVAGVDRSLTLRLNPRPIALPAISGEAAPRCRLRKDTAGAVLAAWLEARKVLRLTDWSMKESGLVLVIRGYAQMSGHLIRRSKTDSVWVDTIVREPPFTAVELASARNNGLVQPRADTVSFFAPGPDYVLSDDFLDSHCFSLRRNRARIGLDFFPVRRGREGEIRGTLWLDQDARALERIDFRYGNVTGPVPVRSADGTIEFSRTADGYYIIRRWRIRVPTFYPWGKVTKVRGGEVVDSWIAKARR